MHMNYKTYESMTRVITALVVYEYHYALNYMVYGKSHQCDSTWEKGPIT